MDTLTTARRLADPIGSLGARFMLDRTTFGRCADLGLPSGMAGYVQGRLGVMGDVSADEATEATRLTVDSATDLANGTDFDVLTADERAELVSVAESAVAHTA